MNYRKVLRAKLYICLLVLLVLVGLVCYRFGATREDQEGGILFSKSEDNEVMETVALSEDLVEENVVRNAADVILQEQEITAKKQNATDYSFIRVLLTNEKGGYYFDRVKLMLCEKEYSFTTKQVKKRGVVRMQTIQPEEKITLISQDGETLGEYRGALILRASDEGITIVNQLLLEEYLYQVVPGEMPASYPGEALKAQAILARTYAAKYVEQPALEDFYADLDDTTSFQVYGNKGEFESTTRAVDETKGMVLAEADSSDTDGMPKDLARIYYFSTSCGVTTTTEAWFQRKNPLEQSVFMAPSNQLMITLSSEENDKLQEQTEENDSGMEGNSDITATTEKDLSAWLRTEEGFEIYINQVPKNAYEAENPWFRWTYETSRSGKQLMERVRARYEVQPNQFLSRKKDSKWFIMGELAELGELQNIRVTKRAPGGCVCEIQLEGSKADIRVRTEYSIRYVLCDPEAKVVLQDGSERNMETILPSAFFTISCSKQKKDVVGYSLVGGGFGHGIGMSQNGASKMAEQGMNYAQIASFYYPGYEIVDIEKMGK